MRAIVLQKILEELIRVYGEDIPVYVQWQYDFPDDPLKEEDIHLISKITHSSPEKQYRIVLG